MRVAILLLFSILFYTPLFAQEIIISGQVKDNLTGMPVPGASVVIKRTNRGMIADGNGNFSMAANPGDVLVVSSTGYATREVVVSSDNSMSIFLEQSTSGLSQVVVVGSRRPGRVRTETAVPVDVINMNVNAFPTGRMDLTSVMNYLAPSFNYNKQSGSDGADHVDLATLRGLGPDQTLVLINGKRRHQTAFVSVFGTRGRGNSGTDLNAISPSAIDRIEILRDGASAQYGSDAIAGVINIILKRSTGVLNGNIGSSGFYDPKYNTAFKPSLGLYETGDKLDGKMFTAGLDYGFRLGRKGGFINLSFDYLSSGKTFRQVLDTTSDPVHNPNAMIENPYRRANGDGSLDMTESMFNAEVPLQGKTAFYAFGGYAYKQSDAFAFTRDSAARIDRFPTDANGNVIHVPGIIRTSSEGSVYYDPHIQTHIGDYSLAAGVKGQNAGGWNWDISNTIGYNNFHFFGDKTFNASLGANKTHFDDGGFTFLQNSTNIDFAKQMPHIGQGFNLAMGAEYRYERYTIYAGEPASYSNYDPNGIKATGSQGFPGYQPSDVVHAKRSGEAVYTDAELDLSKRLLVSGAVRLEHYSDFGYSFNYKFSTRFKVAEHFNLRGSLSTGFRAPSLQQINFSSTFTTVQGSTIAEVKIAPNYSPVTKAAGIPSLKQERSLNASAGFVFNPIRELTLTVDAYWVRIKNRVVLSGQFSANDPDLDPFLASEMARLKVGFAQFFANAVNTTNKGIDIVMDYNRKVGNSRYKLLFAGNFQDMAIDRINVPDKLAGTEHLRQNFLSDREQNFILASAPHSKFSINLEYGYKRLAAGTRLTYFGQVNILGYGQNGDGIDPQVPTDADPNILVKDEYLYTPKWVTDFYISLQLSKQFTLYLGVDNAFNAHPDYGAVKAARFWAYNNEPAGPWDAVQMGQNGRRFFARLAFTF